MYRDACITANPVLSDGYVRLPLHLCAPEDIPLLLPIHPHREYGFLGLLDGVHLGGDGAKFSKLGARMEEKGARREEEGEGTIGEREEELLMKAPALPIRHIPGPL